MMAPIQAQQLYEEAEAIRGRTQATIRASRALVARSRDCIRKSMDCEIEYEAGRSVEVAGDQEYLADRT